MREKTDFLATTCLQDFLVNKDFLLLLEENHLTSFSSLMNYPGGQIIKRCIPVRSTVSFELKSGNQVIPVYLKRYHPSPFRELFRSFSSLFSSPTALKEWENILSFQRKNLPTVIPIAAGMKKRGILRKESFLLTKGLEGTTRLEDLIPGRFSPPLTPETFLEKRKLIRELALLTQKMHNLGFNHRDFYLCHILVRENTSQGWELFICDLHRVDRRKKVRLRWRIKDLAALHYSAPENLITARDRIRFMKIYLNMRKLDHEGRLFIMKIARKTLRMKKHHQKRVRVRPEKIPV